MSTEDEALLGASRRAIAADNAAGEPDTPHEDVAREALDFHAMLDRLKPNDIEGGVAILRAFRDAGVKLGRDQGEMLFMSFEDFDAFQAAVERAGLL